MSGWRVHKFRQCFFRYEPGKLCFRWNCRRLDCRQARFFMESYRVNQGAEYWKARTGIWFVTFNFSSHEDPQRWDQIHDLKEKCSKILRSLKRLATQKGQSLEYARVLGVKSNRAAVPYEFHAHVLLTWLPDAQPAQTPNRPNRHHSARLEKWAKKQGLTVRIEQTENSTAVANYCANNVRALDGERLPPRFRRFSYSRKWYPWSLAVKQQAKAYGAGIVRYKQQTHKTRLVPVVIGI